MTGIQLGQPKSEARELPSMTWEFALLYGQVGGQSTLSQPPAWATAGPVPSFRRGPLSVMGLHAWPGHKRAQWASETGEQALGNQNL